VAFSIAFALTGARHAAAQLNVTPPELENVDVVEHLGGQLPLDATFRDHEGQNVRLGDYFDARRPTLLVFAYHTCPMLCSMVLDATTRGLRDVPWTVGEQFDVVSISIDPRDTPEAAAAKRDKVMKSYGRVPTIARKNQGFHFLVGDEVQIRRVTDAVGFQFRWDARQEQYAHPAAVFLATPTGTLARYLYGLEYKPHDLRLGLLEASEGRTISTVEKLLLYCYHYDPQGKRYALVAMNVMRVGAGVSAAILLLFLALLWARERARSRAHPPTRGFLSLGQAPRTPHAP
jgi:protein SCO1/2